MKDLSDLVLTIVRPLVTYPDQVKLDVVESKDFYEYNLTVAPEDIGRIIENKGVLLKQSAQSFTVFGSMHRKKCV